MGSRSTGRKLAMQMLYQAEIRKISMSSILSQLEKNESYPETTRNWALGIADTAWKMRDKTDTFIDTAAKDWAIERISIIDKSILRLAIAELETSGTSYKIIINESVELAKNFSEHAAASFINGILGKFIDKNLCLPE